MTRFLRSLPGLLSFVLWTATFSGGAIFGETVDEKVAALQKLAEEAQARKTAGEPAITAARTKAKELADAATKLKSELSKAQATQKDLESKLPGLQDAVK